MADADISDRPMRGATAAEFDQLPEEKKTTDARVRNIITRFQKEFSKPVEEGGFGEGACLKRVRTAGPIVKLLVETTESRMQFNVEALMQFCKTYGLTAVGDHDPSSHSPGTMGFYLAFESAHIPFLHRFSWKMLFFLMFSILLSGYCVYGIESTGLSDRWGFTGEQKRYAGTLKTMRDTGAKIVDTAQATAGGIASAAEIVHDSLNAEPTDTAETKTPHSSGGERDEEDDDDDEFITFSAPAAKANKIDL